MARPRKMNKKPMTSMSVEENLILELRQNKPWNRTYGEFIHTIFNEWKVWRYEIKELKDNAPVMEEWIKNQENKIIQLNEQIEVLQKDNIELEERMKNVMV